MEHWFVYYTLPAQEAMRRIAALRPMQDSLAAASGVRGYCLRRTDETDAGATLMEVYPSIADPTAFATLLARAVQVADFPSSGRRLERFTET